MSPMLFGVMSMIRIRLKAQQPRKARAEFLFTRYFYEYEQPRQSEDVLQEFFLLENELSKKIEASKDNEIMNESMKKWN